MIKRVIWSDDLVVRLKKRWKESKDNRDEFKRLVQNDKVIMKQKKWNACRLKATSLELFKDAKFSKKKFPFSQLEEAKKQELFKLLADGNVGWPEIFQKFPRFSKSQFRNFAKHCSIGIN